MTAQIIQFAPRLATKRALEQQASEQMALAQGIPGKVTTITLDQQWNSMEVQARVDRLNQLLADWRMFKGAHCD